MESKGRSKVNPERQRQRLNNRGQTTFSHKICTKQSGTDHGFPQNLNPNRQVIPPHLQTPALTRKWGLFF